MSGELYRRFAFFGARAQAVTSQSYENDTASFTDVLSLELTTGGGDILINIDGSFTIGQTLYDPASGGPAQGIFRLLVDGNEILTCAFNTVPVFAAQTGSGFGAVSFNRLIRNLRQGLHTIKLQARYGDSIDAQGGYVSIEAGCQVSAIEFPI